NYSERTFGPRWGVIYAMAPSPILADEIWIGTDDGQIQVTRDAGKTWHNVTPPGLTAWSKVVMMDASHFDPQTAYAAVDRHRLNDDTPHIYRTVDGGKSWTEIVRGIPQNEYLESIKQDPGRNGLLYAGTNKGVYFSFDHGDTWQSLRMNLPPVEIRDFAIKGKTMVIATFGRSFWAIDDLSPLRQVRAAMNDAPAVLYKPSTAYRTVGGRGFFRGSSLAAATDMDPLEVNSGEPPMSGAEVDYYLAADSGPVTLDILDGAGKVVRQYSSTERPRRQNPVTMDTPAVWANVPPVLSSAPGMHRWSWDLREVPAGTVIPAGRGSFGFGGPGHAAAPGVYSVRLTSDGHTYTQSLTVRMGSGLTYDAAAQAAQLKLAGQITNLQRKVSDARRAAAALHEQMAKLQSQSSTPASLQSAVAALDVKAHALEGFASEPPNPDASNEGDAVPAPDSLTGLNGILGQLSGAAQSGPGAPDATVTAGFARAQVLAADSLARWEQLTSQDVPALNAQLRQANLPELELSSPAPRRRP
ncbi:MAG: hypothetical protein ACRD2D_12510, partial [Terriglobales bacterium]